jgi:hypothetical protein
MFETDQSRYVLLMLHKSLAVTVFSMPRWKFVHAGQIPHNRSLSDKERGSDPLSGL